MSDAERWEVDSHGVYCNGQCIAKVYRAKDRSLGWSCQVMEKSGFETLPEIEADIRALRDEHPDWFKAIYGSEEAADQEPKP
jgi:hypothetical protein